MPTHLALPVPLGHHGNNAVTSRSHGFFATLTNAEGRFLTKKWQLRVSYKLWQCYCFLKLLLPSVWQNNLPSLEVSYPNMGYVPVSQGISSLCGRDFFYLQRVGNLIDVEKVKFW